MTGETIDLAQRWTVGSRIGGGGFGQVYEVVGEDGRQAAAKFVPKTPGSGRELLFVDAPETASNVVPIIDGGEHGGFWVLVMPRAEKSLREHLDAAGGRLAVTECIEVLLDISEALESLDGRVVHRDLKLENVLLLRGRWCLADFGIARYAEASTATDTRKYALSPPYAAPERWRHETATPAADVYAMGVMAFEMIEGKLPFPGPSIEEFREQHLHASPPPLRGAPTPLAAVVEECLFKAPEARPSPTNLQARLEGTRSSPTGPGLDALAQANRAAGTRMADETRSQSQERTRRERRSRLAEAGRATFLQVSEAMSSAITGAAPAARFQRGSNGAWTTNLNEAELRLSAPEDHPEDDWGDWQAPSFDVVLYAQLSLRIPPGSAGYEGRSHSLWYCDAVCGDEYSWYETAFMVTPMIPRSSGRQNPFALDPGEAAAKALWTGVAEFQLAWPFTPLIVGDLDEFIDRWAQWFADAATGLLRHPSRMPERNGCQDS